MRDRLDAQELHRKGRDRAFVLICIGAMLFTPPLAAIFFVDGHILGIPVPVFFLFLIWAVMIFCAAVLSGYLRDDIDPSNTQGPAGPHP
ncbi:MAG: hypothetical protein ACPGO3_07120 [Magnetospiraceae bacterium]